MNTLMKYLVDSLYSAIVAHEVLKQFMLLYITGLRQRVAHGRQGQCARKFGSNASSGGFLITVRRKPSHPHLFFEKQGRGGYFRC